MFLGMIICVADFIVLNQQVIDNSDHDGPLGIGVYGVVDDGHVVRLQVEGSLLTEPELVVDNLAVNGLRVEEREVYISNIAVGNLEHGKLGVDVEKSFCTE